MSQGNYSGGMLMWGLTIASLFAITVNADCTYNGDNQEVWKCTCPPGQTQCSTCVQRRSVNSDRIPASTPKHQLEARDVLDLAIKESLQKLCGAQTGSVCPVINIIESGSSFQAFTGTVTSNIVSDVVGIIIPDKTNLNSIYECNRIVSGHIAAVTSAPTTTVKTIPTAAETTETDSTVPTAAETTETTTTANPVTTTVLTNAANSVTPVPSPTTIETSPTATTTSVTTPIAAALTATTADLASVTTPIDAALTATTADLASGTTVHVESTTGKGLFALYKPAQVCSNTTGRVQVLRNVENCRSEVDCGGKCLALTTCRSFRLQNATRTCHLFGGSCADEKQNAWRK